MILSKKQTNYAIFQNKERHLFQVEQDFLKMKKVFVHKFLIKNRFHKQAIISFHLKFKYNRITI